MSMLFKGVGTAIVTPFNADGSIDFDAFRKLIQYQINNDIAALLPCGSTGEAMTMTEEEHILIVRTCVEEVNKKVPVIAGAGSNSTNKAIILSQQCQVAGANGILSVVPYYNKPTQDGIYNHFKEISENIDIPIIIYNVPSRVGIDISDETIVRLSQLKNIIGIKDATGNLSRVASLRYKLGTKKILLLYILVKILQQLVLMQWAVQELYL